MFFYNFKSSSREKECPCAFSSHRNLFLKTTLFLAFLLRLPTKLEIHPNVKNNWRRAWKHRILQNFHNSYQYQYYTKITNCRLPTFTLARHDNKNYYRIVKFYVDFAINLIIPNKTYQIMARSVTMCHSSNSRT